MNQNRIRNFCIISHIDHGKSTLADRLLEETKTISERKMKKQFLDQMEIERERGITIKMQPVRMIYEAPINAKKNTDNRRNNKYILNLIDTPGHMDFSYEVERALQACEGAILLVSAKKGIQAQTLANLRLAKKQNLKIIPVINKIDIKEAAPQKRAQETKKLLSHLNVETCEPLLVSAKTGKNVNSVLKKIIAEFPPPPKPQTKALKALVFDSLYDAHKGVIAFVRIFSGSISARNKIKLYHAQIEEKNLGIGLFRPALQPTEILRTGEVGWIATGVKKSSKLRIGETITSSKNKIKPVKGYKKPQPMVFANIYPAQKNDFTSMQKALDKLILNDPSLTYQYVSHPTMGRGLRIGVLGMLHLEVTLERLKREFGTEVKVTPPSVSYKVKYKKKGEEKIKKCLSHADFPEYGKITAIKEPITKTEIVSPVKIQDKVHQLAQEARGKFLKNEMLSPKRINLSFELPLAEIMTRFYNQLKSISQGFASFSYELIGYKTSDLVKMEVLIAGDAKEGLAKIVHRDKAQKQARKMLKELKELLPQQHFPQKLQAKVRGNIIAREDIPALKKDVTEGLYGGDYTRKKKLIKNQREGKKEMQKRGQVEVPKEVYQKLLDFS